jgi:hypothetical protein
LSTKDKATVANQDETAKLPPESLTVIQNFVDKLGGLEKAKLAIDTLDKIRKAA